MDLQQEEIPAGGEGAEDLHAVLSGTEDDGESFSAAGKPAGRTTPLLGLLLVVVIGGALYFYMRPGPKNADAAATTAAPDAAVDQKISQFLQDREQNRQLMQSMLHNTQKIVRQFLNYPTRTQVPVDDLKANPFRSLEGKTDTPDTHAAARKQREKERAAALQAARGLQLQSILRGGTSTACMIDGTLYKQGAQVGRFTLEKINADSVIISSGAYRFELKMTR